MNWKEFTKEIQRTAPLLGNDFLDELHMAIGISTEAGEILDTFKKSFAYGNNLDITNLKEELGDSFWYAFNLMRILNIDFEDVLDITVNKLKVRYKEGWSKEEANNRNLDKERKVLEGSSQLELFDDKISENLKNLEVTNFPVNTNIISMPGMYKLNDNEVLIVSEIDDPIVVNKITHETRKLEIEE